MRSFLSRPISRLRSRLATRRDSEHEQALLRVSISVANLLFLWGAEALGFHAAPDLPLVLGLICLYIFVSVALFAEIVRRPEVCRRRRVIGIVADNTAATGCLALTSELGAPMTAVLLFITFGNGFRYGVRYLYLSQAIGFGELAFAILYNPAWTQHPSFGIAALFGQAVLPLYVATLVSRVHKAREQAEAANQEKTRFLSSMSHEMRTPLNAIIGINELLLRTPLSSDQGELVRTSKGSAQHMLSLVNNVLDFSKIEAGRIELEQLDYDFPALLEETLRPFQIQASAKKLLLRTIYIDDFPIWISGSPLHVRQILVNLVGNAIKFTDQGSVVVQISRVDGTNQRAYLRVAVSDTGIGMSAEASERVFESFYQADQSITRTYGGSGLGTSIAKQLVELMDGRIGVQSLEGGGTTFTVDIPVAHSTPTFSGASPSSEPSSTRRTVAAVLAEDASAMADTRTAVEAHGGVCIPCVSVVGLLQVLRRDDRSTKAVDLVAIDARTLRIEATEVARSVAATSKLNGLSMVLFHSKAAQHSVDDLARAGYTFVFSGPLSSSLLASVLRVSGPIVRSNELATLSPTPNTIDAIAAQSLGLNVLVAEDNETNKLVVRRVLENAGHTVAVVSNGQEVLDMLERQRFDVVVVDGQMPLMGGVEALKLYRMIEPVGQRTPFVMFTANATTQAMEESRVAGFDAFLTKPIEPQRLLATLASLSAHRFSDGPRRDINGGVGIADSREASVADSTQLLDATKLAALQGMSASDDFVVTLVSGFLNEGRLMLGDMAAAVESGDIKTFRELVHALRGSAGSLGADKLFDACAAVGRVAPDELLRSLPSLLDAIRVTFSDTEQVLQDYLSPIRAKHAIV